MLALSTVAMSTLTSPHAVAVMTVVSGDFAQHVVGAALAVGTVAVGAIAGIGPGRPQRPARARHAR